MKHKSIAATILALGIMISNAGIVSAHNDNFTAKNTVAYHEFLNLSSSQVRTMNATEEGQSKLDQVANNEDINSIKYFAQKEITKRKFLIMIIQDNIFIQNHKMILIHF